MHYNSEAPLELSTPVSELTAPPEASRLREIATRASRLVGRAGLVLALTTAATVATTAEDALISPDVAAAEGLADYPWADAAPVPQPPALDTYTWGYLSKATCDGKSAAYNCSTATLSTPDTTWYYRDQWGYDLRNCTSYVAWRVAATLGKDASGLGTATSWNNNAPAKGWTVDHTPEPGDIAHWEGDDSDPDSDPGHVAFVESVNADGSVKVTEFNKDFDGNPKTENSVRADNYIDVNGTGVGLGGGGGQPQMLLDTSGKVWAKDSIGYGGWTGETPSTEMDIALGDNALQVVLDGAGKVWAKNSIGNGGWTQETAGDITEIAAGANNQHMILDTAGQVWAKSTIGYGGWTKETGTGIVDISAGSINRQMILDSAGRVWSKIGIGLGGWTQETTGGIIDISAGDAGLQMIKDTSGNVWAKKTIGVGGWTQETTGGVDKIAAGNGGLQMILDTAGRVWAKENNIAYGGWTQETDVGAIVIAAG